MGTMRILLVDDEKEFVTTLAERLELRGFKADWATNSEDAFRHVEKERYDVAVLDVKMPRVGGFELKGLLKERCPKMKFIFLTGHGSEADYITGCSEGACYFLKPIDIQLLVSSIQEVMGKGGGAP